MDVELNVDHGRGPEEAEVAAAVRQIRKAYNETQAQFAARMKATIRTITRYETAQPPKGEALIRLWRLAKEKNLADVADTLARAFLRDYWAALEDAGFVAHINARLAESFRQHVEPGLKKEILAEVSSQLSLDRAGFELAADEKAFVKGALRAYRGAGPEQRQLLSNFPALLQKALWWAEIEEKIRGGT
jgi:transcriptional regulator with XRE-family HTH domain